MKKLQIVSHFSEESLKSIMNSQSEVRAFKDWQIICSAQTHPGKHSGEIAQMSGVSRSKVLKSIKLYNQLGENWRSIDKRGGRKEGRCHLSLDDEKLLMKSLGGYVLAGKILAFKHIKDKLSL